MLVLVTIGMEFSEVLSQFDIKEAYILENKILGQVGYLFLLDRTIAYLYQEDKDEQSSILYIGVTCLELDENERQKIQSLMRLNAIAPTKLDEKDLRIYSQLIEEKMDELLVKRPDLKKGSSHMAFSPRNYTRFSENLLFDFNYIYDDQLTAETIENFDEIFDRELRDIEYQHYDDRQNRAWTDDQLYRYLLELVRTTRESINGQISPPQFLLILKKVAHQYDNSRICIHLGPKILYLKTDQPLPSIFERATSTRLQELSDLNYVILSPNRKDLDEFLGL